jgi:hypothetical protein
MGQGANGNPRRFCKGLKNPNSYGGQHFLRVNFRACFLYLSGSFMDELSQISHSIRGLSSSVPFPPVPFPPIAPATRFAPPTSDFCLMLKNGAKIAAKPVPLERKRATLMQRKGKTWSDPDPVWTTLWNRWTRWPRIRTLWSHYHVNGITRYRGNSCLQVLR